MIATIWELWNDRKGDFNKMLDVIIRIALLALEAVAAHLQLQKPYLVALNLSAAIFFFFFDYLIAFILIRNGTLEPPRGVKYHWFTYVAKDGVVDNVPHWKNANPWLKLAIRTLYLSGSLILFLSK